MRSFGPISIDCTGGIRLHLLSTGVVAVKQRYREARTRGVTALLDFVTDTRFTDPLPIWVMVIEHPEGIFLVDTGETARIGEPGYFRSSGLIPQWFDTTQFRFLVEREQEVDRQLAGLGMAGSDVREIILTHLHFDHTDGLRHFPGTPVAVHRLEWEKPFGMLPKLLPPGFSPRLLELSAPFAGFPKTTPLTKAGDVLLVHTPGHTYGHCSVLVLTGRGAVFFAADICYSAGQLIRGRFTGANASHRLARDTYERVLAFARHQPVVFLPAHDPDAGTRLQDWEKLIPPSVSGNT